MSKTNDESKPELSRWWLSWVSPEADPRPVREDIAGLVGWWVSGSLGLADSVARSLVALVEAHDEARAAQVIGQGWPEQLAARPVLWRFFARKPPGWVPNAGRFPLGKAQITVVAGDEDERMADVEKAFERIRYIIAEEAHGWMVREAPEWLAGLETAVAEGKTPAEIYRYVLEMVGPSREAIAHRAKLVAIYLSTTADDRVRLGGG